MTTTPARALQMQIELPGMPQRVEAAATKPAVASRSEIGYAQAVTSQWWLHDESETTPELRWPQSVAVYDQMRRTDAQVTSLLEAVTLPIRRTPWRLDPAGARANVVKFVANDLGLPIVGKGASKAPARTKGKFSWPDHLRLALLELVFGHMFFEQVYSVNDAGTEAHLKKLAPRMPRTIDQINVAADGGLVSIQQCWTDVTRQPQPIPVDRLVAYVRNREGGNWLGQSVLRACYKHWLLKDRLLRVQAQTIERNGMGIPVYEAQEGASPADLAAGKAMATAWRSGEAAGSATPFGAKIRLVGVEGTLPDADPAIRYHDEQIARAALAHFLNLGTQTGSWALGATFADFFVYSLQTLAQHIADVTTQHVIEDLVDLNFGEDEPAPKLVFDEIGSQQAATAQALKTLVDAGIIHPDQVLEESSRQQYGLPPADPATATPPPGQASPTPPEPTAMGDLSVAASRRRRSGVAARHRYNPDQLRDPGGEGGGRWVQNPAAGAEQAAGKALGRLSSDDGLDLELSAAPNGGVVARFPFPDGAGQQFDAVTLPGPSVAKLRSDLADADAARKAHAVKVRAADRRFGAATEGTPEYQAAQEQWFALTDGHEIAQGSVPGETGGALHWAVVQEEDKAGLWLAVAPPDAGPGWEFYREVSDGAGGTFPAPAVARLRKQLDSVPVTAARPSRRGRRTVKARFDPGQRRDPNGTWGDGIAGIGLPELDLEGFDLIDEAQGAFGSVQMGVDDVGDVRLAFHEGNDARAVDLGGGEFTALADAVQRLADYRDTRLPDDAVPGDAYDEATVGAHRVDLLGNGIISVVFGAEEPDPYTVNLDPPDGESDDADAFLRAAGEVEGELDGRVTAALGHDTHPGGEELKHYWVYGEGAAKWATWTELYHHLRKYLTDGMAKRTAAAWFHLRYGFWPGDHRNLHASADLADDEADEWEEGIAAIVAALTELSGEVLAGAFDEAKHPRGPGGKFRSTVDKLKSAIETHRSGGGKGADPFAGFDREQLRRAAKTRGITLGRGEDRDSIAKKLLDDLGGTAPSPAKKEPAVKPAPAVKKVPEHVQHLQRLLEKPGFSDAELLGSLHEVSRAEHDEHLTGPQRSDIADELRAMAASDDPDVRRQARQALRKFGGRAPARKRAPKKAVEPAAPASGAGSGKDLIGSDPESLARRVAKDREHRVAADRSLSAIGAEQGFDGKPRVVSKAEMDRLVAGGAPEVFRGVIPPADNSISAEQMLEDVRSGGAYYGTGMYGNGYYWGDHDHAAGFATPKNPDHRGAIARGALSRDAKVVDFWKDLEPEHEAFLKSIEGRPDEAELRDVYGDPGRYAAARGYDAILIAPDSLDERLGRKPKGQRPWYNVLNRSAVVMEAA